MRWLSAIVVLVLVAGATATWFDVAGKGPGKAATAEASAWFSPRGGAVKAVAAEIGRAHASVRAVARDLNAPAVIEALAAAHKRGLPVEVALDAKAGAASANALYDVGVGVYLDRQHAIDGVAMSIDDETAIVSTAPLTEAAEQSEAGATLIARAPAAAAKCAENIRVHLAHAESLETVPASKTTPATPSGEGVAPPASSSPFRTTHRQ